jgi:hypothetical protein
MSPVQSLFRAVQPAEETLGTLVAQWTAHKNAENEAKARRIAVELKMAAMMPADHVEARVKADVEGMRVTIEYGVTRKVDAEKLGALWDALPPKTREAFKWEAKPVLSVLRGIQDHTPAAYAIVATCITTTPAKPSVSVAAIGSAA